MATIQSLKQRLQDLKTARTPYDAMYTVLGQYLMSKQPDFSNAENAPGASQLSNGIWDTTGIRSVRSFVSAVVGAVWKGEGRTFRLKRPDYIDNTQANNEYYYWATKELARLIDVPPSEALPSLTEACEEFAVYGSGAVGVSASGEYWRPFNFRAWPLQNMYFDVGRDGRIASVYYRIPLSVREVVETYGPEAVSSDVLSKYNGNRKEEKIIIIEAVEPRAMNSRRNEKGEIFIGQEGMPYAGYVFEEKADEGQNKFLEIKGYPKIPIKIARCYPQPGEAYARSLGMDALPAVLEINAHRESLVVGGEMKALPPVTIFDDGSLAGGIPDLGPRGMNVFNASGQIGSGANNPIMPIITVGELQSLATIVEGLKEEIAQHFLIDRLFDLNNKTRMTLGEAEMRYSIRNDALGPIYTRIINGWITPMLEDCFDIAFDMGLMGVGADDIVKQEQLRNNGVEPRIIPPQIYNAMVSGFDVYSLEYISPAASILRSETYRGTIEMAQAIMSVGQIKPEMLDRLNVDKLAELLPDMTGGDSSIISSLEEAQKVRDGRAQLQQQQMELESRKIQAQANQSNAQAQAAVEGIKQNAMQK